MRQVGSRPSSALLRLLEGGQLLVAVRPFAAAMQPAAPVVAATAPVVAPRPDLAPGAALQLAPARLDLASIAAEKRCRSCLLRLAHLQGRQKSTEEIACLNSVRLSRRQGRQKWTEETDRPDLENYWHSASLPVTSYRSCRHHANSRMSKSRPRPSD